MGDWWGTSGRLVGGWWETGGRRVGDRCVPGVKRAEY